MRRSFVALALLLASLWSVTGRALTEGREAPSFRLPLITGSGNHELVALRGKVVVIDFWASWCRPCLQAFPDLDQLQREFGPRVQVLAVSIDEDPEAAGRALGSGYLFAALLDRGGVVAGQYGVDGALPATVVLDQQGRVRLFHRGGAVDGGRLRRLVRSLLEPRPIHHAP